MRRILAGAASGAVGLAVFLFLDDYRFGAAVVALATYGLIDWLGLLPPPFERNPWSTLHCADPPKDKDVH